MIFEFILMVEIVFYLFYSYLCYFLIVGFLLFEIMIKRDIFSLFKLFLDDFRIFF